MRFRPLLTTLLVVAVLGAATFAATGSGAQPRRHTAIIRFDRPTWVASEMLVGSYLVVHDDDRMARGEPCTTIHRLGVSASSESEVVAFHCVPRTRGPASTFRVTIDSSLASGADTLVEYQFAGDTEGHGVPLARRVMETPSSQTPLVCVR